MNILITGGAGFIGSHLVDALAEKHEVVVLDNLEHQVHTRKPEYLNPEAEYLFADIRNEGVLAKAVEDVEVIFHEAAAVGVGQSMYQVEKYVEVNTMATAKLLDFLVNEEEKLHAIVE